MPISGRFRKRMEEGSWIRRMFEEGIALKKQFGEDNVFDLSLGNPILDPPPEFTRELRRLAESPAAGLHRYMENAGYPETRTAVAEQLTIETGVNLTAADIIMTCGAAGAMNVALRTILNEGEEVIVFAPYFTEFMNYIEHQGGTVKIVPTDEYFLPVPDTLEANIGSKTRAIIINSPNNPTGVVYPESLVHQIAGVLDKKEKQYGKNIFLISDEAYRKIIFDGLRYPSPLKHYRQSIIAASHSKDLGLPGERIGYIALHPDCADHNEMMNGFVFCNRTLGFVNAPALMQRIIRHLQQCTVAVEEYQRKRDYLYDNLTAMGYKVNRPQGAFYMFPRSPLEDDVAFVRDLQRQWHVLTTPGNAFGTAGYFRISYTVDDKTLEGAMNGFRKAAEKYKLQ